MKLRRTAAGVLELINRQRVKLAAVRVGREYLIRPDSLEAFLAACNPEPAPTPVSPSADRKRREQASEELIARLKRGRGEP